MTKFAFRLDAALRLRHLAVETEFNRLQELTEQRNRIVKSLSSVGEERAEASTFVQQAENPQSNDLRALSLFTLGLNARTKTLKQALARNEGSIAEQNIRLMKARQDERSLSKLRQRRLAEWKLAEERVIENTAQELWLCLAHYHQRRPGSMTGPDLAPWRRFLIGQSRPMLEICDIIHLIAAKRCTVLITGDTGTGKEVIARALHAASNRADYPMVSVNCTALPATLIETELFGHAKGAFTGAHSSRVGRFEQAHRGTIFLDEIGDLPLDSQAKLLRILQEREFERVGSSETVRVDVRVVAASNVDLEQAARERKFREDLYYRLNVVPIHMPALRERRSDIPLLLEHFLEKISDSEAAPPKTASDEAVEYLRTQDWPGNVRQLEHAVQMAFALSGERSVLYPDDFQVRRGAPSGLHAVPARPSVTVTKEGIDFDLVVARFERSLLHQALTLSNGNKARAADLLRIKRTTLLAKMKVLDLPEITERTAGPQRLFEVA